VPRTKRGLEGSEEQSRAEQNKERAEATAKAGTWPPDVRLKEKDIDKRWAKGAEGGGQLGAERAHEKRIDVHSPGKRGGPINSS